MRPAPDSMAVADAHCDFLYYMATEGWDIAAPRAGQAVALPYMRAGGAALQLFAAWIDPNAAEPADQQFNRLSAAYGAMLSDHAELVPFTRDFDPASGRIATILTVEGGEALMGSVERLHAFYELGVRALTLTWNASNELAHPAMSRINRGLTRKGREVVREMERINMAIDVAHLSQAGIDEVLRHTRAPIFSSHTNARAVCEHRRSLSDRHIRAIAERGGLVCVNYYPPQLKKHPEDASIADIVAHIASIADIGGVEHVALGSDFDGMARYPKDMRDWRDVPKLIAALEGRFSGQEIRRIAYENLAGYMRRFI